MRGVVFVGLVFVLGTAAGRAGRWMPSRGMAQPVGRGAMFRLSLLGPALLAFAAACTAGGAADLTDAERSAIIEEIRTASAAWKDAAERAEADGVMSHYVDAPGTVILRSDHSVLSFEELRDDLRSAFGDLRSQSIVPREQRIEVLARDVAAESAVGDFTSTWVTGAVAAEQFAFTRVWVRREGRWRIAHSYLDVRPVAESAPSEIP